MTLSSRTLRKGPGVDTLSTKIYTEVKKGIKPEMYALSTLYFYDRSGSSDPCQQGSEAKGKTIECTLCEHFIVMNNTPGFSRDTQTAHCLPKLFYLQKGIHS